MKQNFKITGKGDVTVTIIAQIDSNKSYLTRGEVNGKKAKLQNAIHEVLRNFGYDVREIKLGK